MASWVDQIRGGAMASLTGSQAKVYTALLAHASHERLAWPSVATLAGEVGLSARTVQYALRGLVGLGYIELAQAGGGRRSTVYRLLCTGASPCTPAVQRAAPQGCKGLHPKGAVKEPWKGGEGQTTPERQPEAPQVSRRQAAKPAAAVEVSKQERGLPGPGAGQTLLDEEAAVDLLMSLPGGWQEDRADAVGLVRKFGAEHVRKAADLIRWRHAQGQLATLKVRRMVCAAARAWQEGRPWDDPRQAALEREERRRAALAKQRAKLRREDAEAERRREAMDRAVEEGRSLWSGLDAAGRERLRQQVLARLGEGHAAAGTVRRWDVSQPPGAIIAQLLPYPEQACSG